MINQTAVELVAWKSTGASQLFELKTNQSVLVGKSNNCGLRLQGHDISEIHCRIGFEDGHLWVQDWMSRTGTRVNGEAVTAKTKVGQGSVIEVGGFKIQISKSQLAKLEASQRKQPAQSSVPNESEAQTRNDMPVQRSEMDRPESPERTPAVQEQRAAKSDNTQGKQAAAENERSEAKQSEPAPVSADDVPPQTNGNEAGIAFFEEDELFDRETVELLLAEIDDLRAALAQRDSDHEFVCERTAPCVEETEDSDATLLRIQDLSEEANRAEERVSILEEMLHAAEDANRSEVEERSHLEAWVGDIEKRVGQREQEHAAEIDALRERLNKADEQYCRLQRQSQQASNVGDSDQKRYEDTLQALQQENRQLQDNMAEAQKELRLLKQKYDNQAEHNEVALRSERAKIAKEHAEMSRLKFEYAQKIQELEQMKPEGKEADPRLESLREHRQYLREMNDEKERERQQRSLSARLKRMWNLVES